MGIIKKRFSKKQIIGFLRETEAGIPIKELRRKQGFSEASFYLWRNKFGGMSAPDGKRRKTLKADNTRLKRLLHRVDARDRGHTRGIAKKVVNAPASRQLVRHLIDRGLSERRALAVTGMSASFYRYQAAPYRNTDLQEQICELAQRHRRYGAGMIYLKLRQQELCVNHKRVERLYQAKGLQVRRRHRKKVPSGEHQPLFRPAAANQVWSMDFVFDRSADGRVIKCLTITDDATHEAVAIEVERAISGLGVTRVLDRLALSRGLPRIIRTDNGKEFCGKDMLSWASVHGIELRLIEPGKPNQNAYIESFNGRLRDECLNDHWFTGLLHARAVIEAWRREYNTERPKKALGGLTPSAYARQLMASVNLSPDSKPECY